jgi:hypothetical protein
MGKSALLYASVASALLVVFAGGFTLGRTRQLDYRILAIVVAVVAALTLARVVGQSRRVVRHDVEAADPTQHAALHF